MLTTIPFHRASDLSVTRARLSNDKLEHILPPAYHGNPVYVDGSLVFTDFGWGVLKEMRAANFNDAKIEIYASAELGHFGGGQSVFRLIR